MKIGIITFQNTTNYGALLQTTAIFKILTQKKFNCEVINYRCDNIERRELPHLNIPKGFKPKISFYIINYINRKKYKTLQSFSLKNIKLSNLEYTRENLEQLNNEYDLFLVGSDMIWELNVTGEDYTYYLDFVKDNSKKRSFSSSFGYSNVPSKYLEKTREYLSQFSKISVRENEGQKIIYDLLEKKVPVTLDPTLLLNKEDWNKIINIKKIQTKYVLVYFNDVDNIVMNFAKKVAKEKKLKIIYINSGIVQPKGVRMARYPSVEQFINLIANAEYIITSSYHGVAFAINYNKQFYYYNRTHQSRIESLVNILKITNRNIDNELINLNKEIDYECTNYLLNNERKKSLNVLLENIL